MSEGSDGDPREDKWTHSQRPRETTRVYLHTDKTRGVEQSQRRQRGNGGRLVGSKRICPGCSTSLCVVSKVKQLLIKKIKREEKKLADRNTQQALAEETQCEECVGECMWMRGWGGEDTPTPTPSVSLVSSGQTTAPPDEIFMADTTEHLRFFFKKMAYLPVCRRHRWDLRRRPRPGVQGRMFACS